MQAHGVVSDAFSALLLYREQIFFRVGGHHPRVALLLDAKILAAMLVMQHVTRIIPSRPGTVISERGASTRNV
jgi:hypothetical protein